MSAPPVPLPGTPEAVAQGCTCAPHDDDGPRDPRWPGWLTEDCPMHGAAGQEPEPALSMAWQPFLQNLNGLFKGLQRPSAGPFPKIRLLQKWLSHSAKTVVTLQ